MNIINLSNNFYGNYERFKHLPKINTGLYPNESFNKSAQVSFKQNYSKNDLNQRIYQIMKEGFGGEEPEYTRVTTEIDEEFGIGKIKSFFDKAGNLRKEVAYSQYNTPVRMSLYNGGGNLIYNAVSNEIFYDNICIVEMAHFDNTGKKVLDYKKEVFSLSKS